MITLRKLESLSERTRGRKLLGLLDQELDPVYEKGLTRLALSLFGEEPSTPWVPLTQRQKSLLRQRVATFLGIETADWDLQAPPDRNQEPVRFPFHAWLDDLRSPFNVGSILRTAEAFGFTSVWSSPATPGLSHPRTRRTAMGAENHLETGAVSLEDLRGRWTSRPVFALELGGTDLPAFSFPSEGLVLLGSEELGLSPEALDWADESAGRVSIPLYGRKASLNVGVAFGILASAWVARQIPQTRSEG